MQGDEIAAMRDIGTTWKAGPHLLSSTIKALPGLRENGLVERAFFNADVVRNSAAPNRFAVKLRACWHFRLTEAGRNRLKELETRDAG